MTAPVWPRPPAEIRINNAFALWFGAVRRPARLCPAILSWPR